MASPVRRPVSVSVGWLAPSQDQARLRQRVPRRRAATIQAAALRREAEGEVIGPEQVLALLGALRGEEAVRRQVRPTRLGQVLKQIGHIGVGGCPVNHLRGFRHLPCLGGHGGPFLLRSGQGRPRLVSLVGGRSGAVIAHAAERQQDAGVPVGRGRMGQLLQ